MSISEYHPELANNPCCATCGAVMIRRAKNLSLGWKCMSCGGTEATPMSEDRMQGIQRYAMEPTFAHSNCSMNAAVALVKHPKGQVVLYEDASHAFQKLRDALESLRQTHYECEDGWYSCPKSEHGCFNEGEDPDSCTCGASRTNAIIDAALREATK